VIRSPDSLKLGLGVSLLGLSEAPQEPSGQRTALFGSIREKLALAHIVTIALCQPAINFKMLDNLYARLCFAMPPPGQ
jgi:hypothetical protein